MRIIREHAEARWLPSRHHFALARLVAFVRLAVSRPTLIHGNSYAVDRGQSGVENQLVAAWLYTTTVCYITAALPFSPLAGVPTAAIVAAVILQVPFFFVGGLVVPLWNKLTNQQNENNIRLNSITLMAVITIESSYFATVASPVRFVAWFFFAMFAANALAFVVMWLLRGQVQTLEAKCGA